VKVAPPPGAIVSGVDGFGRTVKLGEPPILSTLDTTRF
jgi:hypothetical protein